MKNLARLLTSLIAFSLCGCTVSPQGIHMSTFLVKNGLIYYIDYECNNYMDEWNFDNWGIKYWSKTPEFMEYLKSQVCDA